MRRILIADADPIVQRDLRIVLLELDYGAVLVARDGAHALRLARRWPPDAALVDIASPAVDGLRLARALTADSATPVVVLTTHAESETVAAARRAGAAAYLLKPARAAALRPAIEVAIARGTDLRDLRARRRRLEETVEAREVVQRAKRHLIDTQGLTEGAAYRRLQKASMDTRTPLRLVAEQVLIAS